MPSSQQISTTPEADRDRWRTPAYLIAFAARRWGAFDIDLAADQSNAIVDQFFALDFSALDNPWWGGPTAPNHGWLNPPYSRITPWAAKACEEQRLGFSTTLLLPAYTSEAWFSRLVDHAAEVVFIAGRISFLRPDGEPATQNRFGSVLVHLRGGEPWAPPRVIWIPHRDIPGAPQPKRPRLA